jgi:dephospho-CoA kinase
MIILGLVGMPGAGKGECAKFANKLGFKVINMGDLVRLETEKQGLELKDENVGKIAHGERKKHGYGVWARRTLRKIEKMNLKSDECVIIDGIRGSAEVDVFINAFLDRFKTIAIKMPTERRFELLQKRKRKDAPISRAEFDERDERESKWGIEEAIEKADYFLFNTGTLDELRRSMKELLDVIMLKEKQ